MASINSLTKADSVPVAVTLGDETVNMQVNTKRITSLNLAAAYGSGEIESAVAMRDILRMAVTGWDLKSRDPEEGEDLAAVPDAPLSMVTLISDEFTQAAFEAVIKAVRPPEAKTVSSI